MIASGAIGLLAVMLLAGGCGRTITVRDIHGKPVSGAYIIAVGDKGEMKKPIRTGVFGSVRLPVSIGTATRIEIHKPDHATTIIEAPPPTGRLETTLIRRRAYGL